MDNLEKLQELAAKLPKEVKDNAAKLVQRMGEKIEGIGDRPIEWKPENLRVVQAMSDRSKLPKAAQIGSIIIGENVVEMPFEHIPLRMWDMRQYWSPDKDEAKMLCSSPDAKLGYIGKECRQCEYGQFNTETNRSECNKGKTVVCIAANLSVIFLVTFTKTNYKNGMDYATLMRKAGVAPYKRLYQLKTQPNQKHKNVESLVATTENKSTPEAYIAFLEELFTRVGQDREVHLKKFYEIVLEKNRLRTRTCLRHRLKKSSVCFLLR
jgi:hypothetical protein